MREHFIEKFLEAGKYLQIEGVAGDTRQVHLSDNNDTSFSDLDDESDREILNSTRTSDHVEALRDADHLRSFVLDVSNISHGFNRSMKDVTVDIRRLSREDAQRHYASIDSLNIDATHGGSRRSSRLTASQINYCEDENVIQSRSINRSKDISRNSQNNEGGDLVILDEINVSETTNNRSKETRSKLSQSRNRSLLSPSVPSPSSSTLSQKRSRSERRQDCDYCHESIADAEIDNHVRTFHRRKSRQSCPGTPATSKSFTNLGSLYRTKPMESKKSIMSKSSSNLARTELFPRKSTTNNKTANIQRPSNSSQQSDRITMMRTLECNPAPANNESSAPSVPDAGLTVSDQTGLSSDIVSDGLVDGSTSGEEQSSLQMNDGDSQETTSTHDNVETSNGDNIVNEQMEYRSGNNEEAIATEVSEPAASATINETKLIVTKPPTTSSDYSSNIVVLGGRSMCRMCGMQVSDNPKSHFLNKHTDLFG